MRVIIKQDAAQCAKWAADYVSYKIKRHHPTPNKPFVLGLPTGSTPLGMYQELIKQCASGKVSFEHVATFNMDEYIGLPPEHPQSYHYFMKENFFKHINIQTKNIHILNGMTRDYEKECTEYENAIKKLGGINLFIGGIGTDGHIAFNEPGSSLTSRTRIKTLRLDSITSNARFFDNDITQVPRTALTVGIGTIMDAQEIMIIATGRNKAEAIKHGIEGALTHMWPISVLQMHQHGIILCDEEAASMLEADTIKYFKEIENRTD